MNQASDSDWLSPAGDDATFGPEDFIRFVHRDALSAERRCVVWSKNRGAKWCATADEVGQAARAFDQFGDAYATACLHAASAAGTGSRGSNATAAALSAIWADIDVLGPDKKKPYPPTANDAVAHLSHRIEFCPSLIINTGGGLHMWWLLDEPLILESDEDRAYAARLVERFQARLRAALAEKGWAMDATHDLARVMRLPGLRYHKSNPQRLTVVLRKDLD